MICGAAVGVETSPRAAGIGRVRIDHSDERVLSLEEAELELARRHASRLIEDIREIRWSRCESALSEDDAACVHDWDPYDAHRP